MKVVLLIAGLCTLALVRGCEGVVPCRGKPWREPNQRPCQRNPDKDAYNTFVCRHIIQTIPRTMAEWEEYLKPHGLCDRPFQSFMKDEAKVKRICNGSGNRLDGTNLCMSTSNMTVYDLTVDLKADQFCKVQNVTNTTKPVIVACDKVNKVNLCLPVHFERYNEQQPGAERCKP